MNSRDYISRTAILSLVWMLGSGAAANAQTRNTDLMPGVVSSRSEPASTGLQTFATLRLANGARVDFVDLRDGHVGVGEKALRSQRPTSLYLASQWQATPLEIYMALAPPGSLVPEVLRLDHAQYAARTGGSPVPRNLTGQAGVFGPADPGEEHTSCDAFGSFADDWFAAFAGLTDYVFAEPRHFLDGTFTFYPGKHVYLGTNTNKVTYLGACNGHVVGGAATMTMQVHRRIKIVSGNDVSFMWVQIAEVDLGDEEKYTFYSNFPASYRGRVRPTIDGSIVDHYVVAVAYDKTPGLATP
jgi:hypothetical protein